MIGHMILARKLMIKAIRAYIPLYCNCMRFHNAILILYCKPLISLYILCICILAINIIDIDNPIVLYPKIYMPNNCRSLSFLSCNLDRSVIKLKRRNKLIYCFVTAIRKSQAGRCTSLEWREYKLALTCAY